MCMNKLRAVKEFVNMIVRCLIELRAVKEFVRIIVRSDIVESCKGVY